MAVAGGWELGVGAIMHIVVYLRSKKNWPSCCSQISTVVLEGVVGGGEVGGGGARLDSSRSCAA